MSSPARPSRSSVRERAAAARAAQQAAERRRERIVRGVVALVVVLVVAGIGLGVYLQNRSTQEAAASGALPRGVTAVGGGIPYGPESGVPVLDVWEDFQCPACKSFEAALGSTVEQLTDEGKVRVVYHPVSFLDGNLGGDSSLRAAAASGCAADAGKYREFHDQVYRNQPAETQGGAYTDEQLLQFGRDAGITGGAYDTFAACVQDGTYKAWASQVEASMAQNQITSTPTLVLDGRKLDVSAYTSGQDFSPEALTRTIEEAAAG